MEKINSPINLSFVSGKSSPIWVGDFPKNEVKSDTL